MPQFFRSTPNAPWRTSGSPPTCRTTGPTAIQITTSATSPVGEVQRSTFKLVQMDLLHSSIRMNAQTRLHHFRSDQRDLFTCQGAPRGISARRVCPLILSPVLRIFEASRAPHRRSVGKPAQRFPNCRKKVLRGRTRSQIGGTSSAPLRGGASRGEDSLRLTHSGVG